jgi:protein pelota
MVGVAVRILYKDLKHGLVKLQPESSDDLWILATILQPGDLVKARTLREIHFGDRGSGRSSRIPMVLTVKVENVEFQPFTTRLRVRGIVVEGPEKYGVKGKYHTLSIDAGDEVVIIKPRGWSRRLLEKLEKQGVGEAAVIVAIDYDEYAIGVLRGQGLKIIDSGHLRLPGKDDPNWGEKLDEALNVIAKRVAETVRRETPLLVVIAGPGSLKDELAKRVRGTTSGVKIVVDNVSSGGEAGIYEELRRGLARELLREVAAVVAERIIEEFEKRLAREPEKIAYTLEKVEKAVEAGAVEELLVLDELLHSPDPEMRARVEELLRKADATSAEIHFVSMQSPVGYKLKALGGIVALLRYPLDINW